MKTVGLVILCLVIVLGLPWMFMGNDYFLYKWFAPKQANVQRQVFENTYSYERGTIQNLRNEQAQYITADEAHKDALASVILHDLGEFPEDKLPADLQVFISELRARGEKTVK